VIGLAAPVAVSPPGEDVTVYDVIGSPPSEDGAVNETVAWASPAVAVAAVGALGTVAGTTGFEGTEGDPVPTLFVAVTVKV
jgi:hypothetical protein